MIIFRSIFLVFLVCTWGLALTAKVPEAPAAEPVAKWQFQGQAGVVLNSLDENLEPEWDHQISESFMVRAGALRWNKIGSEPFFWAYGGQLAYQTSTAAMSSPSASAVITTDVFTISPEARFGLNFNLRNYEIGAYTSILYHALNNVTTKLESQGFTRRLDGNSAADILLTLGLTVKVSETWVLVLGFDQIPSQAVSLGFIYEL